MTEVNLIGGAQFPSCRPIRIDLIMGALLFSESEGKKGGGSHL
jgi:hypothetical protein